MAFPASPANGAIATVNGVNYTYNDTNGAWNKTSAGVSNASVVTTSGTTFTGPVTFQSTVSYSTPIQFAAGNASAPSMTFSTATSTGMYTGSGALGLTASGVTGLYINSSQNVGVGTVSPRYKFDVNGNTRIVGNLTVNGNGNSQFGGWVECVSPASGSTGGLRIKAPTGDGTAYLQVTNNAGNAEWVNLSFTNGATTNSGNLRATSLGIGTAAGSGGQILATGLITAFYSDRRLKTISGNIEDALSKLRQLNGVRYVENEIAKSFGYDDDSQQVGVIAQEVQAVQPEAIALAPFDRADDGSSKSGETYLTVHYEKLVPLLIEAIKELSSQVDDLKAEIDIIKKG